ncbi:MAG: CHASE2 domain-containing protein, partial [Pseudomonadota bacterium]
MAGAVKSTNWRLLGEWALLFIVTTLIAVASFQQSFIQRIDASLLDFAAQATLAPPDESIVIVEIDDRTLDEIETWPWDRARHADLVTALSAMNPELIVMDILFLEPSEGEGDAQLADAIAQAGNVVLPHTFVQQPGQINGVIPAYPLDEFAAGASGIGHVAVGPDPDGVVRQIQLAIELESGDFPHLAAVTKNLAAPVSSAAETWPDNPVVPMQKAGSFRSISASEVLSQQVLPEFITGKIVLVGATAQGLGDRYAVASGTGQIIPGVEVQANTLDALLQDRLITAVPDRIAILILVLVLALLSIALWKLSPRWSLWTSVGLIAALLLGSMGMIIVAGKWLPVSAAILGIVIIYPLWGWRRLAAVSRFLQSEAEKFRSYAERKSTEDEEGFDTIARQVSLVKGLLGETRETLSFLRKVISASPDPMLVFDGAGQLVMQNSQADQLFGDADTNSPKNFDQMLAAKDVAKSASGKEITMPGGRVFLVAEAEFDVGDEGEVLTLRDITRIRRAEEERQQTLEFLSHDMRSPQAAIIGLTRKLGDSLEEKERLTRIEDQARRTLKLT